MIFKLILYIVFFLNIFTFLPFCFLGLLNYRSDEIVSKYLINNFYYLLIWFIINFISGIINLYAFIDNSISINIKENILFYSFYEGLFLFLLYIVNSNYYMGRYFLQHILSFFVYTYLIKICIETKRPYFARNHPISFYLYLPYTFWIFYLAFINFDTIYLSLVN